MRKSEGLGVGLGQKKSPANVYLSPGLRNQGKVVHIHVLFPDQRKKSTLHRLKTEKSGGKNRGRDPDHQHSVRGENLLRAPGNLAKAIRGHRTRTALAPSHDRNHGIGQNGAGRKRHEHQWKSPLQFVLRILLHTLYLQLLVAIRKVSCNSNNICSDRLI